MSRTVRLVAAAALALAVLPALGGTTTGAVAADPLYRPLSSVRLAGDDVRISPDRYAAVRIDLAEAGAQLRQAPRGAQRAGMEFSVPTPDGGTEKFLIHATRTMEAELAAAHPEITTYAGRSLDNPATTIALDLTPMGLHASVRGQQGQRAWYVDPAYNEPGTTTHLSYYGGSVPRAEEEFVEREAPAIRNAMHKKERLAKAAGGGPVTQKIYRLAFTSDPAYAAYFGTENVLAEKTTLINRVNQIYNDDLAIKMLLIDETDDLNFDTEAEATGPDGPCGAHPCFDPRVGDPDNGDGSYGHLEFCDIPTLGRNRVVLGQIVGAANYDVGHIGLGVDGGGIAYLGVVGWDYKGGGCTGLSDPKGDFFAIDYVAHELGHQYSGNHSFNGAQWNCSGGNRNRGTSVEPGSGSSVMAYAGICRQDNLQPHSDPYFSAATLDEVNAYTNNPTLPVVEVQTVSLSGFGAGDTLTLGFGGETRNIAFADYTAGKLETEIEALTGQTVTIADWGYDPFFNFPSTPPDPAAFDATGFQVIFSPKPFPDDAGLPDGVQPTDVPSLTVAGTGVTGFVGETAQGGVAKNGGNEKVATGNRAPTVKAPANRTIPLRTPFRLKGSGKDADGNKLIYIWEQVDRGGAKGTELVSNKKRNGPLFRMFGTAANVSDEDSLLSPSPGQNLAGTNAGRYFPDLAQVLRGNTNAESGTCPKAPALPPDDAPPPPVAPKLVDCYSEFLPVKGYVGTAGSKTPAMHFRLTARDGFDNGGGVGYDEVTLRIAQDAGPFLVTSFNRGGGIKAGAGRTVTWDVNGTKRLAKRVRILLSTDGGRTWTKTLATSTANDGRAKVRIPRVATKKARIMISALGNYFYDVNDKRFTIRR